MRARAPALALAAPVAVALTALLSARPSTAGAAPDAPGKLKLTQKVELLGGRLEATLPAAMKLEPRSHGVMAAAAADEDETRAVLDLGKARLVMMTYDVFALTGTDFKAAIKAQKLAQGESITGLQLEPLAVARPLTAIADVPPLPKGTAEANLVYTAWIGNTDTSVQRIAFYLNPEAARTAAAAWAQLARAIVLGLKPAGRTLDTRATSRKLGAGHDALTLATPDGWTMTTQPGPDFAVYHLRKLAILGAPAVSCGIYLGGHASYQFSQSGIDPAKVKTSPAKLLRSPTLWQTWTADGSRFTTEAMASRPGGSVTVHTWCSADTEAALPDLRKMLETIQ
jgi:hypothetical protein